MTQESIRVATLNVWGVRDDWPARRAVLAEGFAALQPDLLALQETVVRDDLDQVAGMLGEGYHVVHSARRESDGQGVSVASRWPVTAVREPDLALTDRTADFACTALAVTVEVAEPVGAVLFVNHFPDYQLDHEHERELQAVAVAKAVADGPPARHTVVAGDMDADPDAASMRFWCGRQSLGGTSVCYRDAWDSAAPGRDPVTYTGDNPLMPDEDWPFARIDHILVRCGRSGPTLAVRDCRRIFDAPVRGVQASDHYGLLADLAVPEQRP